MATRRPLPQIGGAPQGMNFTGGPPGSSGGLTGAPQNPYMQPPTQYGYGQAPGQSGLGYYEQQTPVGSFAAADRQRPIQQQYAGTSQALNPYIGQTTGRIGQQQSVMPYAQQIADAGRQTNPFLGQTTAPARSAGTNQYMGQNPYLQQQVGNALQQAGTSFADTVLPQFDRMDQASGSFGNTGVQAARERAMGEFGRAQANAATNAYMQDYGQTQQLAENSLNRGQTLNLANAGLQQADIARNLGGGFTAQQLAMQGLGQQLGAGQFDATLGQQGQMFNVGAEQNDLGRNTNAALGLGTFNAGQANQMGQFNAGQGNQLGMYGANLNQALNMFNTGNANTMLENRRTRDQNQGQFDANLDRSIYNDNMNWQRTGQQDQINLLGQLLGWNQAGIGNATTIQNTPLNYWQQFAGVGQGLGGMGGTNSQNLQGNPILGLLGGWQLGSGMFGG